jgi:hypothetical protein
MLGGGPCVAPPSVRLSGGGYAWLRGGLADIANGNLPKIRSGAVQKTRDVERLQAGPRVQKGERNVQLFRYCNSVVGCCDDLDQLIDAARTWADSKCAEPLPDAEIVATAYKVWKFQGGRKRVMQNIVEAPFYSALITDLPALALYSYLSAENGPAAQFMVADGLGPARGWPQRFVPKARRALLDMGAIKYVRYPRKGVPALFRWNLPPLSPPMREGIKDYLSESIGHLGACREPETAARDSHLPGEPEYRPTLAQGRTCTAWARPKLGRSAPERTTLPAGPAPTPAATRGAAMTGADQPGSLSWLRQAGALLLAGLVVCGSPTKSESASSPLRPTLVHIEIGVGMPIGFVDSQDKPRVPFPVPDIPVMKSAIDDISSVRGDWKVFDVSIPLSGRVLIFMHALREVRPRTFHVALCAELDLVCEQIRWSLAMISELHTKLLLAPFNDRSFFLVPPTISAPRQIGTLDFSRGLFAPANSARADYNEAHSQEGEHKGRNNQIKRIIRQFPVSSLFGVITLLLSLGGLWGYHFYNGRTLLSATFFGLQRPWSPPLQIAGYLPLRARRRPSSVNAALRSSGLPPTPWSTTHPRSTPREMVAADSPIPSRTCHCIGCPSVASYSL